MYPPLTVHPVSSIGLRCGPTLAVTETADILQAVDEIWAQHCYTRNYLQLFGAHAPGVVVDVGANIGIFTLYAKHLWPKCSIHGYEPAPGNHAALEENFGRYHRDTSTMFKEVVAGRVGTVTFYEREGSLWHSMYPSESDIIVDQYDLPAVDLATVVERAGGVIDFLKLDCQFAEWEILQAACDSLAKDVRYISMECHVRWGRQRRHMFNLLAQAGFRACGTPVDQSTRTCLIYAVNATEKGPLGSFPPAGATPG